MSLSALLNLGKKEEPKKAKKDAEEEPPIPPIEEGPVVVERNKADLDMLNDYIGKQSQLSRKEAARRRALEEKEEEQREADRKRVLEDAVQHAAKRARQAKIEADLRVPDGKLCKYFFMAGT
mmetsp:Transcript_66177/g.115329  ORF Transcript_66177/g.115329 Transcript_66177/m.115329 type:complete len:122 (+) Transcript_66177:63-428(+)